MGRPNQGRTDHHLLLNPFQPIATLQQVETEYRQQNEEALRARIRDTTTVEWTTQLEQ